MPETTKYTATEHFIVKVDCLACEITRVTTGERDKVTIQRGQRVPEGSTVYCSAEIAKEYPLSPAASVVERLKPKKE